MPVGLLTGHIQQSYKYMYNIYMGRIGLIILLVVISISDLIAQEKTQVQQKRKKADISYLKGIEEKKEPVKIVHAEPLFIDLIRDLGARKGEREWNVGLGLTDNNSFDSYTALVEYEFAPVDRLGMEVELPFDFYYTNNGDRRRDSIPDNRLNSLKLAAQYTLLVSAQLKTSLAIGYIHEFEMAPFRNYGRGNVMEGNVYNPFFVAAKRWGNNFHTLVYTGPRILRHLHNKEAETHWQTNTSFHFMIPGTRNFVGIEFNKDFTRSDFDMTIRPQLRVSVSDNLLVGIVTGIPIKRENERFSSFIRLIYEPSHKHH